MKRYKRIIFGLIVLMMTVMSYCGLSAGETVWADELACNYLTGRNIGRNNYTVTATRVSSYLVPLHSGFMRVQGFIGEEEISVSYYDNKYKLLRREMVAAELPRFGGFFATDSAYYIVTGQSNPDQKDDLEVYRVTKYDTNWNRVSSCGLYGANTTEPFSAGSCRMDIDGKYLIIRTCHQMYKSGDGLNHQANVTIEVDTSSMKVTDSYTIVMNTGVGYVSHSFNQFVKIENHSIVSVDHGDAYPRSICFMKYSSDISDGKFQGEVKSIDVIEFPGQTGTNATGASVGGFELSDSKYLIAGNSVVQDEKNLERRTRNIYVASVDKRSNAVNVNWLTAYPEGEASASTPHMVKISNTSFMVLWTRDTKVYYVLVDGSGKAVSKIYSMDGELSDCVPVVSGKKLIWYTWENGIEKFYEISLTSLSDTKVKTISFEHEYERVSKNKDIVVLKCKKCGKKLKGTVLNRFTMFWKKSQDNDDYYWSYIPNDIQKEDVILFTSSLDGDYSSEPEFREMIIESNDPKHCITSWSEKKIYFTAGGKYTIKVYPKYNPEIAKTFEFTVNPQPEGGIETEYGDGVTTETILYKDKGKISIDVMKTYSDEYVEEANFIGIKGNSVKLTSYYSEKNTVTIPEYVKSKGKKYYVVTIGKNLLGHSDCIESVKLGSRVSSIAKNAFRNEKKLKKIEINAASLKSVGEKAFKGIYSKAKIILNGSKKQCNKAKKLIEASGIGKKVKIIFNII